MKKLMSISLMLLWIGGASSLAQGIEIVPKKMEKNCEDLVTGKFMVTTSDGNMIAMERTLENQIETIGGKKLYFSIDWIDQCSYKLAIHDLHKVRINRDRRPIRVRIDEINGNNYTYFISKNGRDWEYGGAVEKVADVEITAGLKNR